MKQPAMAVKCAATEITGGSQQWFVWYKLSITEACYKLTWWLSGRALDLRFTGRGFGSWPVRFYVT